MSNQNDFLTTLKVGDAVIYRWGSYSPSYTLQKVARTTKTQIILENDARFRKDDGREVGDWFNHLVEANDRGMVIINHQESQKRIAIKYRQIKNARIDELSEAALDAIQAIIDAELTN